MAFPRLTSPIQVSAVLRRMRTLELRMAGLDYDQISETIIVEFGKENLPATYDRNCAYRDIWDEVRKYRDQIKENVEDVRDLEVRRLDAMIAGLWEKARGGNFQAVDRILKIMQRRADLLGLDAKQSAQIQNDIKVTFINDWRNIPTGATQRTESSIVDANPIQSISSGSEMAKDDNGNNGGTVRPRTVEGSFARIADPVGSPDV